MAQLYSRQQIREQNLDLLCAFYTLVGVCR